MAKMGRVWGNWMIQVLPTNKKLIDRSTRIIANIAGIPYLEALEEDTIIVFFGDHQPTDSVVEPIWKLRNWTALGMKALRMPNA